MHNQVIKESLLYKNQQLNMNITVAYLVMAINLWLNINTLQKIVRK